MSVGSTVISQSNDGLFRIEARHERDAAALWDDSQDEHTIVAVNNSATPFCVVYIRDGYSDYRLAPAGQETLITSFINGGGDFQGRSSPSGRCDQQVFR